jgi:26S proteasome non-ATPase regulatory subunit 9
MDTGNNELLKTLIVKKEEIESDIKRYGDVLKAEGDVGMNGPLVDAEGYPRADIDLYNVRLARQHINCLQNDYKMLMNDIENHLYSLHSEIRAKQEQPKNLIAHKPFLRVTQIDSNSPSQEAGLQLNDEIMQFGPFVESNTDKTLGQIAELVSKSENKIILLNVLRKIRAATDENDVRLESVKIKLIPKKWSGHGLLGCKIVPFQ